MGDRMSSSLLPGLHRRLTNPTFYLKWSRNAVRPLRAAARWNAPEPATDFETRRRVCLTRGEGGRTGDHRREDLGRVRVAEMRAAARELGAASVDFLGFVDPVPQRFRIYAPDVGLSELAALVAARLAGSAPDWVIAHGSSGEYWHPAHVLLHRAVGRAWAAHKPAGALSLVTFNAGQASPGMARLVNRDDLPTLRLDVSAHAGRRVRVMMAHRSQATLLLGWAGSYERFVELTNPEHYRIRNG
jgi:N-acetylglucosamine malate deacetylase 2